jgi:hypothetical protein
MKNKNLPSNVVKGESKSFAFNYDLSSLPEYESYGNEMLIKSFLGLTTTKYASIRMNLKGTTELIGFTESEVILQDASCGWNPTGETIQSVVEVKLCNRQAQLQFCPYDLYNTYLSQYLSNDNFQEQIPFAETVLEDVANRTANQIEYQLWLNKTATGATPYNSSCFDGFATLISTGNGATHVAYTAATASNGLDVFSTYYAAIPENVLQRDDLVIFCGYADYRGLIQSMRNQSYINLFTADYGDPASGQDFGVILPATNVRVVPTQALTGQGLVVGGPSQYMFVGMNGEQLSERMLYDPFQDIIKLSVRTTYGAGAFSVDSFFRAS